MRVISGSARGRNLLPPVGSRVRPTADRVKEAVFSLLSSRFGSFEGLRVLDLFTGSGSLGIEALSRGAARAVFVDSHPDSIKLTRQNLQLTGLDKTATVMLMDAARAIDNLSHKGSFFDIIIADPPYADKELTESVLEQLACSNLTTLNGILVFETDSRSELLPPEGLQLSSRRVYGDTAICIFELAD